MIIPTYKPQNYLWECLDSLCNQTLPFARFEIIVVLNGCKDPYYTQIWKYIDEHPKVNWRFLQTDQSGVSNARNIGLDVVAGDYVTFIDDDDYVSPTFLESLYAKANRETIVLSNVYAFYDGKPEEQRYYRITESYKRLHTLGRVKHPKARKFFSCPSMKLIPMCFIQGRRFDVRFRNGEDSLFMFMISDCFKDVDFSTDDAIYYRRYREGSAVMKTRTRREIVTNEFKLLLTMLSYYMPRFWKYNFEFAIGNFLSTIHGMIER